MRGLWSHLLFRTKSSPADSTGPEGRAEIEKKGEKSQTWRWNGFLDSYYHLPIPLFPVLLCEQLGSQSFQMGEEIVQNTRSTEVLIVCVSVTCKALLSCVVEELGKLGSALNLTFHGCPKPSLDFLLIPRGFSLMVTLHLKLLSVLP